jgi:diketogulonate reductase-like aldo/keto reductase
MVLTTMKWPCGKIRFPDSSTGRRGKKNGQPLSTSGATASKPGVGQAIEALCRAVVVTRADLFLQTKFTYEAGEDHRLPYDSSASLSRQVSQSLAGSLEHPGTGYVDSYVEHGPASGYGWTGSDEEVWADMLKERDAGRTRLLGVSNVSLAHLEQMPATLSTPSRNVLISAK